MVLGSQSQGELVVREVKLWVLNPDVDVSMIRLLRCFGGYTYLLVEVLQVPTNVSANMPSSRNVLKLR